MDVSQCASCFAVYEGDRSCPRCGFEAGVAGAPTVLVPDVAEPVATYEDDERRDSISWSLIRWGRQMVLILVLGVASVVVLDFMADRNQAAQASWLAQSQLGGKVDARRAELRAAVTALQDLYSELVSTYSQGGMSEGERINWVLRWRDQLGHVPVAYRLNVNVGPGSAGGGNARAEQSLRNAMLYLTSLERAMAASRDAQTVASLDGSFKESLEQAREDLD